MIWILKVIWGHITFPPLNLHGTICLFYSSTQVFPLTKQWSVYSAANSLFVDSRCSSGQTTPHWPTLELRHLARVFGSFVSPCPLRSGPPPGLTANPQDTSVIQRRKHCTFTLNCNWTGLGALQRRGTEASEQAAGWGGSYQVIQLLRAKTEHVSNMYKVIQYN